jgi:Rrf2 family protein
MMTMKARYALKALGCLAEATARSPVLLSDIAAQESIPKKFLELILRELRQHGIVDSKKGRGGGYRLVSPPSEISVASVLRAVGGPLAPLPCLSSTAYRRCDGCEDEGTCGLRLVIKDAHDASLRVLETQTLADLARRTRQARLTRSGALRYAI